MIDKIYEILKEFNIPVKYMSRPRFRDGQHIVISYHLFNRRGAFYGDGRRKHVIGNLQIDIFHKRDLENLEMKIIRRLEDENFKFEDCNDYDDTLNGIRLYHTILRFNYLEREE